ncbi:TPM domain-containing protein [Variovorax sp. GT1P44]|uniref:TPM domain-containing protein n=1 Tax=Variovorax sp. GT1P44 TaxID=3443742 RepID=UPI003F465C79
MMAVRIRLALTALLLLVGALFGAHAQGLLPVPPLSARGIDQTGTLSAAQREALEAKLKAFEDQKGSQIVVLMVPTTQPEDIASYANRVGNAWKIGRKEVGDGILVVVAKNDRKMRIEVAKTLEGAVPDLAAAHIIDDVMKPHFRQNDFAGGLDAAVDQLIARVKGEALPEVDARGGDFSEGTAGSGFNWQDLAIFLFVGVLVAGPIARRILGKIPGSLAMGGLTGVVVMVLTSSIVVAVLAGLGALLFTLLSMAFGAGAGRRGGGFGGGALGGGLGGWGAGGGGGGFGGGSSGGGGFSSGGGGDFGGGGASGDW